MTLLGTLLVTTLVYWERMGLGYPVGALVETTTKAPLFPISTSSWVMLISSRNCFGDYFLDGTQTRLKICCDYLVIIFWTELKLSSKFVVTTLVNIYLQIGSKFSIWLGLLSKFCSSQTLFQGRSQPNSATILKLTTFCTNKFLTYKTKLVIFSLSHFSSENKALFMKLTCTLRSKGEWISLNPHTQVGFRVISLCKVFAAKHTVWILSFLTGSLLCCMDSLWSYLVDSHWTWGQNKPKHQSRGQGVLQAQLEVHCRRCSARLFPYHPSSWQSHVQLGFNMKTMNIKINRVPN